MEFDATTLIYIVAVIAYFLYSSFANRKKPEQHDETMDHPETPPGKKVSFDDLLKEIRRDQGQRERDLEQPSMEKDESYRKPKPVLEKAPQKYVNYEDPEQFPVPDYDHQQYETSYQQYEAQPLVKLDDQVDIQSSEKILQEVEEVSEIYQRKNRYAAILKEPQSLKDAIVVSEILTRKYF